jgi:hypothetical protein
VSVENVTSRGIWLFVRGAEYFLDYERYPWFREAKIGEIQNVRLVRGSYLRWPDLDVDLELDCLAEPEKYPLIYR